MHVKFTKMHGLGNDFIIIDNRENVLKDVDLKEFVQKVCQRRFSIGADGLILLEASEHADYKMRIFNADGSEPEMCGNGIRCLAAFIFVLEQGKRDIISIDTKAGVILPSIIVEDGKIKSVEVDMGEPILDGKKIPTTIDKKQVINEKIAVEENNFNFTAVSIGNPHAVIFSKDVEQFPVETIGPLVECHSFFPKKANVEFVQVNSKGDITIRVWERGVGETMACGTGACAAVVACVLNVKTDKAVVVHLPGGDLSVEWLEENGHIILRGPVEPVYTGEIAVL
ncbi:diaminopimelate epimerase [Candidatus Margulisiibacteriota bacterium]